MLSFLAVLFLDGCSYRVAYLTFLSEKNIGLSDALLDATKGQRQKGEDCRLVLLGIPFGLPNKEEAVDKALEAGKDNVMVDDVTESKITPFLIASVACIVVEGTVLNAPVSANKPVVSK